MNIITYSVFGNNPFYYKSFEATLTAARVLFPKWKIRIYHDNHLKNFIDLCSISSKLNLELIERTDINIPKCGKMLWRILPLFEKCDQVEFVICRDIDSLPLPKERLAVEEFILLNGTCHNIVDNIQHDTPLMGGLCGFNRYAFYSVFNEMDFNELLLTTDLTLPGSDQKLLSKEIWKYLHIGSIEHQFTILQNPNHVATETFYSVDESMEVECILPKEKFEEANKLAPFCGADSRQWNIDNALEFYKRFI